MGYARATIKLTGINGFLGMVRQEDTNVANL